MAKLKIKLDLGAGRRPKDGFIKIDKYKPFADVVCDFEKDKLPYDDDTVDEIYSSHLLEHLSFEGQEVNINTRRLLDECYRVLKIGGKIQIVVPDMEEACRLFIDGNINLAFMMIFGGRTENSYDLHFSGYSTKMLKDYMEKSGFKITKITHPEYYGRNICIYGRKT